MSEPRISILEAEDVVPSARTSSQFPFLDEFVAQGVDVHFEAMGHSQFWMLITHPDGRRWHLNFGAVNDRAKGYSNIDEETR